MRKQLAMLVAFGVSLSAAAAAEVVPLDHDSTPPVIRYGGHEFYMPYPDEISVVEIEGRGTPFLVMPEENFRRVHNWILNTTLPEADLLSLWTADAYNAGSRLETHAIDDALFSLVVYPRPSVCPDLELSDSAPPVVTGINLDGWEVGVHLDLLGGFDVELGHEARYRIYSKKDADRDDLTPYLFNEVNAAFEEAVAKGETVLLGRVIYPLPGIEEVFSSALIVQDPAGESVCEFGSIFPERYRVIWRAARITERPFTFERPE